tara:strand:- start:133 stop:483 length:351 start_codon:yes stop_codon:yes gene_type:complete
MYDTENIFAKIIRKEIPCDVVYEDNTSIFFNDINPQAKIHVLGIPKVQCIDLVDFINTASKGDFFLFFENINKVINQLGIRNSGYRIISNSGDHGGQEVPHFHIHILAGEKIGRLR